MIEIKGTVTLTTHYCVELEMSLEEFDRLSEREQNEEIESAMDWRNILECCETDCIDVYEIEEVEE